MNDHTLLMRYMLLTLVVAAALLLLPGRGHAAPLPPGSPAPAAAVGVLPS